MGAGLVRYQATRAAISLGAGNPLVRSLLRLACQRHGVKLTFSGESVDVRKENRTIRIAAKHFVYALDMARAFDQYFGQVVPADCNGILTVDYSRPRLQRYAKSDVEFELTSFPEEEEVIDSYFRWYRPKPGDVVFDVGAYCGVSAYHLAKAVGPSGKVYAFEPDLTNYSLLQRNIERHALSNVVPLNLAIAGSEGYEQFCNEGTLGSSLLRQMTRATVGQVQEVATTTLERACERYGVPAFMKIDIEGSEIEVLAASLPFLSDQSLQFVLDTNHWVKGALTSRRVEALFAQCGYVAESSAEFGSMTTWARKQGTSLTETSTNRKYIDN